MAMELVWLDHHQYFFNQFSESISTINRRGASVFETA